MVEAWDLRVLVTHRNDIANIVAWFEALPRHKQKQHAEDLKKQQEAAQAGHQAGEAVTTVAYQTASTGKNTVSNQANDTHVLKFKNKLEARPLTVCTSVVVLHWLFQWVFPDNAQPIFDVNPDFPQPASQPDVQNYIFDICVAVLWWIIQLALNLMCQSWLGHALTVLGLLIPGLMCPSFSMEELWRNWWKKCTLGFARWLYEVVAYVIQGFYKCLFNVEASTWFGCLAWLCMLFNLVLDELTCSLFALQHCHHLKLSLFRQRLRTAVAKNTKHMNELADRLIVHLYCKASSTSNEANELNVDNLSVDKDCDATFMRIYLKEARDIKDLHDDCKPGSLEFIENQTYQRINGNQATMCKILKSHVDCEEEKKPNYAEFWLVFHLYVSTVYMACLWYKTFGTKGDQTKYWIIAGWQHCLPANDSWFSGGSCDMWKRAFARFLFFAAYMGYSHVLKLDCVKKICQPTATHLEAKVIYLIPILWHLVQVCLEYLETTRRNEDAWNT